MKKRILSIVMASTACINLISCNNTIIEDTTPKEITTNEVHIEAVVSEDTTQEEVVSEDLFTDETNSPILEADAMTPPAESIARQPELLGFDEYVVLDDYTYEQLVVASAFEFTSARDLLDVAEHYNTAGGDIAFAVIHEIFTEQAIILGIDVTIHDPIVAMLDMSTIISLEVLYNDNGSIAYESFQHFMDTLNNPDLPWSSIYNSKSIAYEDVEHLAKTGETYVILMYAFMLGEFYDMDFAQMQAAAIAEDCAFIDYLFSQITIYDSPMSLEEFIAIQEENTDQVE